MKFAVISDLHGNFPALTAVLKDLPSIDGIICCGDFVGYYPDVNEVCDEMRKLGVIAVRGNHDAYVTKHLVPRPDRAEAYKSDWTRENLSSDNYQWLNCLPVELKFSFDELLITVRHANFFDEEKYLYPDSAEFDGISLKENEVVFFGHTHHPMKIKAGQGFIVNPGSVGQPRDWNPDASYAIIDTFNREVEFRRVSYAVAEFQAGLRKMNWDINVINILSRRKAIDEK
jgi:putative phosphoesterase